MSDIKRYEITWNAYKGTLIKARKGAAVLTVEINHSICTDEILHTINNSFDGVEERLIDSNRNITIAALKLLASACFLEHFLSAGFLNTQELINQLRGCATSSNYKCWPPMDGSKGIKILDCSIPWVWEEDMDVEEVS
ncbi:DUF2528 family protein [Salmonella enterica subsp. enterica serovar Poona]|nr:DUF2528 family protein [Salmonella enterica subsp. enterica serovar Poona]